MPLQKALSISNDQTFGNRLDELARALKIARAMTEDSRKHNRERLARKVLYWFFVFLTLNGKRKEEHCVSFSFLH